MLFREGLWGVKAGREGHKKSEGCQWVGYIFFLYHLFFLLDFVGIVSVHECAFLVITSTVAHS